MDTGRNRPKTAHDSGIAAKGIAWLVALYSRLSRAISGRESRDGATGESIERHIARRSQRVNNRSRDAAEKYERVHTILSRGRQ